MNDNRNPKAVYISNARNFKPSPFIFQLSHFTFYIFLFLGFSSAGAATWSVGPGRTYTSPSKVSTLVHDGDTVDIDAGTYESDVARWGASNLLLRGVGGRAHLKANGTSYGGKAIWVIAGTNTTVDSIEFSLAACPDNNGAGIRQEGVNLTVRGCYFHDNQDGILAGDNPTSDILIEHCEFYNNGYGDGYTHNLYINHVNSLTFRFNYSHHAIVGHELKSRAYYNYIFYNRLANESTGRGSREIDLPNGGTAYIIGNEIEQGPQGENSNMIGYGLEGLSNPVAHDLYLVNNTMVNDRGAGSFVSVQGGTALYKACNNIFAGPGTPLAGMATSLDTASNIAATIAGAGFAAAATYDYHLTPLSPAIGAGADPGSAGTYPLMPTYEYLHPAGSMERKVAGKLDVGAHAYGASAGVAMDTHLALMPIVPLRIYPNPLHTSAAVMVPDAAHNSSLVIYNMRGEELRRIPIESNGTATIEGKEFPAGIYYALLVGSNNRVIAAEMIVLE